MHPAQHFNYDDDWMSFGFTQKVEIDFGNTTKIKKVVCLVKDNGEVIPCIPSELARHGIELSATPMVGKKTGNRISTAVLALWEKSGGKKPKPWTFKD